MVAMKIYFILFLFFALACARPSSNEEDYQFAGEVTTTKKPPVKDGSYLYIYHKNVYNKDFRPASVVTIHKKCTPSGTCENMQYSESVFKDE